MLELVYITVLETVAERLRGSTPLLPTTAPAPQGSGVFIWLRSTEVVHYLGKIEVSGSNPLGASTQVLRPGEVKLGYKVVTY